MPRNHLGWDRKRKLLVFAKREKKKGGKREKKKKRGGGGLDLERQLKIDFKFNCLHGL